jgi:hypothetical protein
LTEPVPDGVGYTVDEGEGIQKKAYFRQPGADAHQAIGAAAAIFQG